MKPMVLPLSEAGRGAGWPPAGFLSFVGSNTRRIMTLLRSILRRLAVDTGADRRGDGFGLTAEPRRDDGAKTAGRAAGRDDEQIIRRSERGVNRLAAVAHHRALADVSPFGTANAGALVDEFGDVALAPASILDVIAQLFRNDNGVIAAIDRIVALVGAHLGGKGFKDLARILGPFVHDLARRHGAHHGDGGDAFRYSAYHRQRLPSGVLLILGDAVGELAGMPERAAVDAAGARVEQIDQREAERAADHGGGAVAVAERVEGGVGADFAADRA